MKISLNSRHVNNFTYANNSPPGQNTYHRVFILDPEKKSDGKPSDSRSKL
jgi:hypothetical protein